MHKRVLRYYTAVGYTVWLRFCFVIFSGVLVFEQQCIMMKSPWLSVWHLCVMNVHVYRHEYTWVYRAPYFTPIMDRQLRIINWQARQVPHSCHYLISNGWQKWQALQACIIQTCSQTSLFMTTFPSLRTIRYENLGRSGRVGLDLFYWLPSGIAGLWRMLTKIGEIQKLINR